MITCAIREFNEETQLSKKSYLVLLNLPPVEECYNSDGVDYKNTYYVAKYTDEDDSHYLNITSLKQVVEISDVKWCSYKNIMQELNCIDSLKEVIKKTNAKLLCL
jgi:8-oxo-dGTP pyrophosphatase MutT (NUDIX family)